MNSLTLDALYQDVRQQPSDVNEHMDTLRALSRATLVHGQGKVAEFGTRTGRSTLALLAGRPAQLTTCDVDPVALHATEAMLRPHASAEGVDFETYLGNTVVMPVISPVDLLFVDTYHTYEQLKRELQRHGKQARFWIALHDTETFGWEGEDGCTPGLRRAIEEWIIAPGNDDWSVLVDYRNNNGLMVLQRRGFAPTVELPAAPSCPRD